MHVSRAYGRALVVFGRDQAVNLVSADLNKHPKLWCAAPRARW